jgi:hypothetical protein
MRLEQRMKMKNYVGVALIALMMVGSAHAAPDPKMKSLMDTYEHMCEVVIGGEQGDVVRLKHTTSCERIATILKNKYDECPASELGWEIFCKNPDGTPYYHRKQPPATDADK